MTTEKDPFDPDRPKELKPLDPPVVPRDAATLILVRNDGPEKRVLMGQRSNRHTFMPDKYVFPGGGVDEQDAEAPSLSELNEACETKLNVKTARSPRTFALTSIRETFEETGLIIGQRPDCPVDLSTVPENWRDFYAMGVAPCLKDVRFIGQAVTPPYRPKRFDARFFIANSEDVMADLRRPADSVELADLNWFTLDEAMDLDLPKITQFVVREVMEHLDDSKTNPAPFYTFWDEKHHIERL